MPDPTICRYCGAIVRPAAPDERTTSSAWTADTPCSTSAPGHAPTDDPPMDLWLVYDDDRPDLRVRTIDGPAVHRARRSLDEWTNTARANATAGTADAGRYELRPIS